MIGKTRRHAESPEPSVGKARGVLHRVSAPDAFHHARIAPASALAGFVQHFWIVRWDLRGRPPELQETLPHPNVQLVFERGQTRFFGVHSARFSRRLEGEGRVFGVKFRPGGFHPFLRRPVSTIADASLPLREVFGADADTLEDDVLACADEAGMIGVTTRFLTAHLPPPDPTVDRVAAIVDAIAADRDILRVEDLVDRFGLNKRMLQRLFSQYVGASPKWVINRYRLHEAVEQMAKTPSFDWASFAAGLGYFDQAHFIRDFKKLVGRSPADHVRAERLRGGR